MRVLLLYMRSYRALTEDWFVLVVHTKYVNIVQYKHDINQKKIT